MSSAGLQSDLKGLGECVVVMTLRSVLDGVHELPEIDFG